jgi:hypothetical protein
MQALKHRVTALEQKMDKDRIFDENGKMLPGFLVKLLTSLNAQQAEIPDNTEIPVSQCPVRRL